MHHLLCGNCGKEKMALRTPRLYPFCVVVVWTPVFRFPTKIHPTGNSSSTDIFGASLLIPVFHQISV